MSKKEQKHTGKKSKDIVMTLTEKAAEKIKEIARQEKKEGFGLKFFVFPGGCSGFQYGMDFKENPAKTDKVFEQNGVKLFVDKASLEILKGTIIDFVATPQGSGFRIDNPNVCHTCSCGSGTC